MNTVNISLGDLADPRKHNQPINIRDYDKEFLLSVLESMILIRYAEEKLAEGKENNHIGGPVHLSAGQEAIAVGISQNLLSSDRIFGTHRSHSHLLALEPCVYELFAEILGKDTGLSRGMGGSMHLTNLNAGFIGSTPIVAGTIPLAVGAAFDAKRKGTKDIGVAYLGDGAVEEGIFHESLNLSSIMNIPTLFVIENNLFASHMHISLRQLSSSISRYAIANDIEYKIVDGNDVIKVYESSKDLIEKCRKDQSPKLLELVTYRQYGHVDWRKDIDVGVNRSEEDLLLWNKRDPIKRLSDSLTKKRIISSRELNKISENIKEIISQNWDKAMKDNYPNLKESNNWVYKK